MNKSAINKAQILELNATDAAFKYSVTNRDVNNMQIVLRAYGYKFTPEYAEYAIFIAENA